MRRIIDFTLLIIVLVVIYFNWTKLENTWSRLYYRYLPCRSPIEYSLGEFDTRFGISQKDFLDALVQAEKIWEVGIDKDLFKYSSGGLLKVNLVYDNRQAVTQQLGKMGVQVSNSKSSYDSLKTKYNALEAQYLQEKTLYETKVQEFESRKSVYESEVRKINSRGGGTKEEVNRLNAEKDFLSSLLTEIRSIQSDLNTKVDNINALAGALNELARGLNITVDKFNTIGQSLGGEFEEGSYTEDEAGRRIDIYQFDNKTKLIRVLAHELGHALGLDHNEDSKAIMYRLNAGVNEKLTTTDLNALNILCKIK